MSDEQHSEFPSTGLFPVDARVQTRRGAGVVVCQVRWRSAFPYDWHTRVVVELDDDGGRHSFALHELRVDADPPPADPPSTARRLSLSDTADELDHAIADEDFDR